MIVIKIQDEYNEFGTEQENIIMEFLEKHGFEAELTVEDEDDLEMMATADDYESECEE